jgi:N,N'-diacetyllegionaminate synthase
MAKVTISAELGINHNGDPEIAERMIDAAAECGADAVKVQSFRCKDFLPEGHPDWGLFEQCEIWPYLERLTNHAHSKGLLFGVTASAIYGVQEAVECGADFLKNASDAILRHDLIEAMLATGLPTWVSYGDGVCGRDRRHPGHPSHAWSVEVDVVYVDVSVPAGIR